MKVSFPLPSSRPARSEPQVMPRSGSHPLQHLGRYSLAIAIGSILPQVYPAIARSMALDEASQASVDLPSPDTVSDWELQENVGNPPEAAVPQSDSSQNSIALSLTLPPPQTLDSTTEATPNVASESTQDEEQSSSVSGWRWSEAPASQPDAPQPDRAHSVPADSFLSPDVGQRLDQLFAGGSNSLVAKAVGSAEGTRTPEGDKTWAYYGHTDPGNGVHNLGTFSYQHGAASPEEADQRQLLRLQGQARQIQEDAASRGLTLGVEEQLNAIDLANQAPKAALSHGGYLDRLQEAYQMGLRGSEAILWARVRSYIDPSTQRWNAPGLGNNLAQIEADQRRRMDAITRALIASGQPTATDSFSFSQLPEQQVMPRSPAPQAPKRSFSGAIDFAS